MKKRRLMTVFVVLVCAAAIGAAYLIVHKHSQEDTYHKCVKWHTSFDGTRYTYQLPPDTDCSPYRDRLLKEYGGVD